MTSPKLTDLKTAQKIWAEYKYWVMGHSQQHYNQIRQLFKGNDWSEEKAVLLEQLLAEAGAISPTKKTLTTAYQHLWGYFKKIATPQELADYKFYMEGLTDKKDPVKQFMQGMIERYQPSYLVGSKFHRDGFDD